MKKRLVRILTSICAVGMSFLYVLPVSAKESSYSYNYDYWGDVQDAPSSYAVCRVFTSSDLGLDVNMKNPSGLTVVGDLVYI